MQIRWKWEECTFEGYLLSSVFDHVIFSCHSYQGGQSRHKQRRNIGIVCSSVDSKTFFLWEGKGSAAVNNSLGLSKIYCLFNTGVLWYLARAFLCPQVVTKENVIWNGTSAFTFTYVFVVNQANRVLWGSFTFLFLFPLFCPEIEHWTHKT